MQDDDDHRPYKLKACGRILVKYSQIHSDSFYVLFFLTLLSTGRAWNSQGGNSETSAMKYREVLKSAVSPSYWTSIRKCAN
jgi:hypothetical protein